MGASRNNPGKSTSDPRGVHVRLYWDIADSNAWRCLSSSDRLAYLALLRQKRSTNNGDLSLPLTAARNWNIKSSATLAKSLRALVAVGLLAVTRRGGCNKGGQRQVSLYRLTDYEAYENTVKNIEASKATNEWKTVKSLAMGRALIRKAEEEAAKTQLQKLAVTASKNEVVGRLTTSKNEVWTPSPTSNIEAGEKPKTASKANASKDFKKLSDFENSEIHTSNIEVLSTVAIPMGELGLRAVGPAAVLLVSAGSDSGDVLATVTSGAPPLFLEDCASNHPALCQSSGNSSTCAEGTITECDLVTAECDFVGAANGTNDSEVF